ncbi:hypothetical protein QTL97_09115 [Sporosarcina thermotolerans]|uniref:Uncharacterized protein n=1 Tax=Sporosarcina thermotolerans TaxID=633404 RepID=A0AAW9AA77_9BACL|nr:hypothetical protein [Sporosarcina thermotolerans]MDW0117094.1 hypothetical protein [Sporosarcina thermotolerans]WHT47813.1 hypothetical protein QNH10_17190 [Sporosarcina thermotolerans]
MPSTQSNWYVRFGCLAPIIGTIALFTLVRQDQFLYGFIFFAIFFGFAALFLTLATRTENKLKAKQLEHLETYKPKKSTYHETHAFVSDDLLSKIAIDERNRRIHFWEPSLLADGKRVSKAYLKMPYEIFDYSYEQLLAIETYENGIRKKVVFSEVEGTTDRLEAIGQSLDPVINEKMSLARKAILRKTVTIEMKIIVDDETKPFHIIRFYSNLDKRLKKESPEYIEVYRKMSHWITLLTFIMDQNRKY